MHGAFYGGWRRDKVVLGKEGRNAIAPDLPGRGQGKTPIDQITLQAYTDRVRDVISQHTEFDQLSDVPAMT